MFIRLQVYGETAVTTRNGPFFHPRPTMRPPGRSGTGPDGSLTSDARVWCTNRFSCRPLFCESRRRERRRTGKSAMTSPSAAAAAWPGEWVKNGGERSLERERLKERLVGEATAAIGRTAAGALWKLTARPRRSPAAFRPNRLRRVDRGAGPAGDAAAALRGDFAHGHTEGQHVERVADHATSIARRSASFVADHARWPAASRSSAAPAQRARSPKTPRPPR